MVVGNETEVLLPVEERVGWQTTCWGCGLGVVLPSFAPMFRCGWCGAITSDQSEMKPVSSWSIRCSKGRDRLFVCFVLLLIFSILFGGVWATFPVLFPTATAGFYVHSVFTSILSFNTLFNFCMAAFRRAGPSPPKEWGNYELVGRKALEGYNFCVYCKSPKPPNSHHCRSCQSCVVDMDHHCPFIGNCVGANNHIHFLLFLLFATVSGLYVFTMSIYVGSKVWSQLFNFRRVNNFPRLHSTGSFNAAMDVLVIVVASLEPVASARAFALIYLCIASLSLVIGVGLLFYHQVQLVYTGETYIDSLTPGGGKGSSRSWANFRKLFGSRHPFLWLLPSFNAKCGNQTRSITDRGRCSAMQPRAFEDKPPAGPCRITFHPNTSGEQSVDYPLLNPSCALDLIGTIVLIEEYVL